MKKIRYITIAALTLASLFAGCSDGDNVNALAPPPPPTELVWDESAWDEVPWQ